MQMTTSLVVLVIMANLVGLLMVSSCNTKPKPFVAGYIYLSHPPANSQIARNMYDTEKPLVTHCEARNSQRKLPELVLDNLYNMLYTIGCEDRVVFDGVTAFKLVEQNYLKSEADCKPQEFKARAELYLKSKPTRNRPVIITERYAVSQYLAYCLQLAVEECIRRVGQVGWLSTLKSLMQDKDCINFKKLYCKSMANYAVTLPWSVE